MTSVAPLYRNLEQELFAVLRGASLECLVCGEFLQHRERDVSCPECGARLERGLGGEASGLQFDVQAG